MCGLYGFVGTPSEFTKKVVTQLGIDNLVRGKDSSGLAYLNADTFRVTRKVCAVDKFLKTRNAKKALSSSSIIGHTRYATHGAVNWENAHPFKHGEWIFAHNGVISNFEEINLELHKNYKVDSQVIGGLLPDKMELLDGSYAVVAFNIYSPGVIYFWRQYSPLFIAVSPEGTFFSSLRKSLETNLPGIRVDEVPDYSYGIIEKDKLSYNIVPHPEVVYLPTLLSSFWLRGPGKKGEYYAASYVDSEETVLERLARSSSC